MAASAARIGLDLLAAVKRLAADEQVRNAARLDRVDVRARDVLAEADEPAEQDRDVPRLERHRALSSRPRCRSATVHPFFSSTSHAMNAPTASGSDVSMAFADAFERAQATSQYGFGTGKRDDRRLRRIVGAA